MSKPRIVRLTSEQVSLPRYLVVEAAMDAKTLADEIETSLAAIEQRIWGGNRGAAITEIARAGSRVQELRRAFLELAGLADTAPTDPAPAVRAAA